MNTLLKEYTNNIVQEVERRPGERKLIIHEVFHQLDSAYFLDLYEKGQNMFVEPEFIK